MAPLGGSHPRHLRCSAAAMVITRGPVESERRRAGLGDFQCAQLEGARLSASLKRVILKRVIWMTLHLGAVRSSCLQRHAPA
jgi:hypothetical protein